MSDRHDTKLTVSSAGLATLTQAQLDTWAVQAKTQIQGGQLPDYIFLLAHRSYFAVQIQGINGQTHSADDFPIISG